MCRNNMYSTAFDGAHGSSPKPIHRRTKRIPPNKKKSKKLKQRYASAKPFNPAAFVASHHPSFPPNNHTFFKVQESNPFNPEAFLAAHHPCFPPNNHSFFKVQNNNKEDNDVEMDLDVEMKDCPPKEMVVDMDLDEDMWGDLEVEAAVDMDTDEDMWEDLEVDSAVDMDTDEDMWN